MKKEKHFDKRGIGKQAQKWINSIKWKKKPTLANMDFKRAALLVLDMQSYFLNTSSHAFIPSAEAIVPGVLELTREYAAQNLPIYYTQHINTLENAGTMAVWWQDLITPEHEFKEVIPDFDLENGILIKKSQYDAFYLTNLEALLRSNKVSQLVICGVMTHLCVETTVRSAFVRGFEVFLPVDGTATYTEEFHLGTLRNLSHGFAAPVLSKEIVALVKNSDED